jgi:hypothetical protein
MRWREGKGREGKEEGIEQRVHMPAEGGRMLCGNAISSRLLYLVRCLEACVKGTTH